MFVIAIFKFIKGALLLALACGALTMLHKDIASNVALWLDQLRIDPDHPPAVLRSLYKGGGGGTSHPRDCGLVYSRNRFNRLECG